LFENFPAGQGVGELDLAPDHVPTGDSLQTDDDVAPSVDEYVPAGQETQSFTLVALNIAEYVPVGHCVQILLSGEAKVPCMQLVHDVRSTVDTDPGGQDEQKLSSCAP
jgi:hypothetical protein